MINALIKQAKKLPRDLNKSLTWDRGKDLSDHKRFTLATDIDVYFCDPQSPWQRGCNENTNGLLGIDKLTNSVIGMWGFHTCLDLKIRSQWALATTY